MAGMWLDWCTKVDLSIEPYHHTNGPFGSNGPFLGVILHVNVDEHGTSDSFFKSNPDEVTPNFEVYKSAAEGGVHQYLPLNYQPWCQILGNFQYAAIETAGEPDEPLNQYQLNAIARILKAYQSQLGMRLKIADKPGQKGLGTHEMGGPAWGGHPCPGTIRAGQRQQILDLASGKDDDMPLTADDAKTLIAAMKADDDFLNAIATAVATRQIKYAGSKPKPLAGWAGSAAVQAKKAADTCDQILAVVQTAGASVDAKAVVTELGAAITRGES